MDAPDAAPQSTRAAKEDTEGATTTTTEAEPKGNMLERLADSAGVGLGPIGMSYQEGGGGKGARSRPGASVDSLPLVPTAPHQLHACCTCLNAARFEHPSESHRAAGNKAGASVDQLSESAGVSLGPIALSLGDSARGGEGMDDDDDDDVSDYVAAHAAGKGAATAAWRQANLTEDGAVDLWLEDGFNAASRMAGGVQLDSGLLNVENKAAFGADWDPDCPVFSVKVTDPVTGKVLDIQVRSRMEDWKLESRLGSRFIVLLGLVFRSAAGSAASSVESLRGHVSMGTARAC